MECENVKDLKKDTGKKQHFKICSKYADTVLFASIHHGNSNIIFKSKKV